MDIQLIRQPLAEITADALLIAVRGDEASPAEDRVLGGILSDILARGDFKSKNDEVMLLYSREIAASRALLVGLPAAPSLEELRNAVARGIKKAAKLGLTHVATTLAEIVPAGARPADALQAVVEAAMLTTYRYEGVRSKKSEEPQLTQLSIWVEDEQLLEVMQAALPRARATASAVMLARDLVNAPANVMTPSALAMQAQEIAASVPFIKATIYDREQSRELGMGAFLAVAQGSAEEPRFIVLEHRLDEFPDQAPIVLIGKGVTFDTGGISIKPAENMYLMKDDMSGAAAVIGTFAALARLEVPLPVVGLVPATDNMISGTSFRPSDVMTTISGKTIENQNTDAEGRLILADALGYAARYNARAIVDLATLTGAMTIAVGNSLTGAFSTDRDLLTRLETAGAKVEELLWEMPLYEPYAKYLKSDVADLRNVGPRQGGAIIAALFLKAFVPEGIPWAHLDIAGVAWNHGDRQPKVAYYTPGATGVGVRLLLEFLHSYLPTD